MKYEIWHGASLDRDTCEFTDHHYCGLVSAGSLEEAFFLTNSIEASWLLNEAVTPLYDGPTPDGVWHSTSPGDIFVDNTGRAWKCERLGWSECPIPVRPVP